MEGKRFLCKEMGLDLGKAALDMPLNFTKEEINSYVKRFNSLDTDKKGYITVIDLRNYFKVRTIAHDGCESSLTLSPLAVNFEDR